MSIQGDLYAFTEKNVNQAPDKPGVYALFNSTGVEIYIGKSQTSIRSRLKDHKSGREGVCTQQASNYKREPCSNPATREKQLLQEFLNTYGRLPKCNNVMP